MSPVLQRDFTSVYPVPLALLNKHILNSNLPLQWLQHIPVFLTCLLVLHCHQILSELSTFYAAIKTRKTEVSWVMWNIFKKPTRLIAFWPGNLHLKHASCSVIIYNSLLGLAYNKNLKSRSMNLLHFLGLEN